MEIATKRCLLREFTEADVPAYLAYQADPRYTEFHAPEEAAPEHARRLLRLFKEWGAEQPRRNYQLALAERREPCALLGCCGLRQEASVPDTAEFGLELAAWSWGQGYATEAARALLGFGFDELKLEEVRSVSVSANVRVVALAQRVGLTKTGTRSGSAWMRARGWEYTEWRLTRAEWARRERPLS